jgi:hypothetical protein
MKKGNNEMHPRFHSVHPTQMHTPHRSLLPAGTVCIGEEEGEGGWKGTRLGLALRWDGGEELCPLISMHD